MNLKLFALENSYQFWNTSNNSNSIVNAFFFENSYKVLIVFSPIVSIIN